MRAEIHARLGQWDQTASDWIQAALLRKDTAPQPIQAGWWVLGPIATTARMSPESDVEPDPFLPVPNETAGDSNAARLHWRATTASPSGSLDLGTLFPDASTGSVRALLCVYAQRGQSVTAQLGSSSSYRFWLNGELDHKRSGILTQDEDDEKVPLSLRVDWNTLLFHVTIGTEND